MPLTGPQIGRIHKAIYDSFDPDELRHVVRICTDERVEAIVSEEKTFRAQVFELIEWADRNGRVAELLRCAHDDRPNDAALAALHAEFKGEDRPAGQAKAAAPAPAVPEPAPAEIPPPPGGSHRIFLSYSHKDEAIKDRLLADLAAAGLTAWTDDGLEAGTAEWQRAIKQAIRACQCMVAILSPDAEQSEWVNIEIGYAKDWGCPIVPVLACGDRKDAIPIALFNTQYVDLRTDYAGQVQGRLLPALRRQLGAPDVPPAAPAQSSTPETPARATPPPTLAAHERAAAAAERGPGTDRQPGESATRLETEQATRPSADSPQAGRAATPKPVGRPARRVAWAAAVAAFVIIAAFSLYAQRDRIWPGTFPTTQADETWTEPVSGITFVRVPAGEFTMGSESGQSDERPEHRVALDEYWIGRTEVTNAQFRPFVEGGGYADDSLWTGVGRQWRDENSVTRPRFWHDRNLNQPDHPVVGVSWHEAAAYAEWLSRESGHGIRLPSEAEWEKAACGTDGRTWPWGDEPPDADLANFNNHAGSTTPAGSYPAGASPYGALDMAGNAWEWTSSLYKLYPYDAADGREDLEAEGSRTLRGGSFVSSVDLVRCAFRYLSGPVGRLNDSGFRVVSPGS